jgi:prophage tail gpP-like protein
MPTPTPTREGPRIVITVTPDMLRQAEANRKINREARRARAKAKRRKR